MPQEKSQESQQDHELMAEWLASDLPLEERGVIVDEHGRETPLTQDAGNALRDCFEALLDPAQRAFMKRRQDDVPYRETRLITPDTDFFEPAG